MFHTAQHSPHNYLRLQSMIDKRKSQSFHVLLVFLLLLGAIALFPPCQTLSGQIAPREFLFFVGGNSQINAGRLLAEALLISVISGMSLIYVWSENS